MELVSVLLLCLLLFFLGIQDFISRSVYWISIPVIFILLSIDGYFQWGLHWITLFLFSNLLIVLIQLSGIWFYFRAKKRKVKILDQYLGLGDILLLAALTPGFLPANFIYFITLVTLLILIIYFVNSVTTNSFKKEIPYAGFISFSLLAILLIEKAWGIDIRYYDINLLFL